MSPFVPRTLTVNRPVRPVTSANQPVGFDLHPGEEFRTLEPNKPPPQPGYVFGTAYGNLVWVPEEVLVER
jgi:hypothetical protein